MVSTLRAGKLGLFLSILVALTGCGAASSTGTKGSASSPVAPSGPAYEAAAAPSAELDAPAPPAASAPAGAAKSDARAATEAGAARSPASRPGLGTEWGESRTSRVHDVSFVRDASRPFATAALYYNDRRGVDAMANLVSDRDGRRELRTGGGAISIAIRDASGNALEALRAGDRTLVVGQAGERYSIVLTNHTGHRFESVVTVDGLDVVNGRPGTIENRGYVLNPYATVEIDGFRQSSSQVAAFRFSSVAESYAARSSGARNVGVIGAAFFAERGDTFVDEEDLRLRDGASPFPGDPRYAQPPRR